MRSSPRWQWAVAVVVVAGLTSCWNFDEAYLEYCDAGHCVTAAGDAGRPDAGVKADAGGSDAATPSDAGSLDAGTANDSGTLTDAGAPDDSGVPGDAGQGVDSGVAPFDGGTVDAGTPDAGSVDAGVDAGSKVDAGCRPYGEACGGFDCCSLSDAGVRMACSRNNLCQEYAPDCREMGFDCTDAGQCCNNKCVAGRCATCLGQDQGTCTAASDCCPGYTCGSDGTCTSATTRVDDGNRCPSAGYCTNGYCAKTAPHDGVCTAPTSCSPLASSMTTNCCPGLDAGATCCLLDAEWCNYDSDCCSGNCIGMRCTAKSSASLGERCWSGAQCTGSLTVCDPVGFVCSTRLCLPFGKNPYWGCCSWSTLPGSCVFSDGGSCLTAFAPATSASQCCSGAVMGTVGNYKCTDATFY